MTLNFKYEHEDQKLSIKADTGLTINIYFEHGEVDVFYLNQDEFDMSYNFMDQVHIQIKDEMFLLSYVLNEAASQYQDLYNEAEQEMADEESHNSDLRSPYMTGRI